MTGAASLLASLLFTPLPALAVRHSPGTLSQGLFQPSLPPFPAYGPEGDRPCPRGGIFDSVPDDLGDAAKKAGHSPPKTDGRLCAIADTLLGWPDANTPPSPVVVFLSQYFGLPTSAVEVLVFNLETEDSRDISEKIVENARRYLKYFGEFRYGMASMRLKKGLTRVALVLLDEAVVLDPLPRRLDLKQSAKLSGHLAGNRDSPQVLLSDSRGQLSQPPQEGGKSFAATVSCGEKPARLYVEVRATVEGRVRPVAAFPVTCGLDLPGSVPVPTKDSWPAEIVKQEHKVLDNVNTERTAAGLAPLAWDEGVADVARSLADAMGEMARKGTSAGKPEVRERLEKAGIAAALVVVNPAQAGSSEEAQAQLLVSPAHRANFMNPDVTTAGIGISVTTLPDGRGIASLEEIFLKVLPPMDVNQVRQALVAAIAKRRADEHKAELAEDPTLSEVAQSYAAELAAARGDLPPERDDELLASLKKGKGYASVSMLLGAATDPLAYAKEPKVLGTGDRLGVGIAQGDHPRLGKNTPYVVVLVGTARAPEKKKGKK